MIAITDMDIVVTDMSMPTSCGLCPLSVPIFHDGIGVITLHCSTKTGRQMYAPDLIDRKDRPEWCPLRELADEKKT